MLILEDSLTELVSQSWGDFRIRTYINDMWKRYTERNSLPMDICNKVFILWLVHLIYISLDQIDKQKWCQGPKSYQVMNYFIYPWGERKQEKNSFIFLRVSNLSIYKSISHSWLTLILILIFSTKWNVKLHYIITKAKLSHQYYERFVTINLWMTLKYHEFISFLSVGDMRRHSWAIML